MANSSNKVGVNGYFGMGNLGDEIFLKQWQQLFPGCERIPFESDGTEYRKIIIGGGDLLVTDDYWPLYWRDSFMKRDVYVYGVGVPDTTPEKSAVIKKYQRFLSRAKYVSARDEASQQHLKDWGIDAELVPDMAWAYEPDTTVATKPDKNNLGVTLREQPYFSEDEMIEWVSFLQGRGWSVILIPCQSTEEDYELHRRIQQATGAKIIPEGYPVDDLIMIIANCDAYMGMRLHGLLMAMKYGVPVLPIGVSRKFAELMRQVGNADWVSGNSYYKVVEMITTFEKGHRVDQRKVNRLIDESKQKLAKFVELVNQ